MTTKYWTKISTTLSEVLTDALDKAQVDRVMAVWNTKKDELSKIIGSERRVKKKKDPNAPKRWKTGYILFCNDQREKVKKENPRMTATEITTRMGELWKVLDNKEKIKYNDLSLKDKKRYENEMSSYTPPPCEDSEKRGGKGKKKEHTGPKRPLSAYMHFCLDIRDTIKKDNPRMSGKEVLTEIGNRWKKLTPEQKVPYESKQKADKERYEKEKVNGVVREEKSEKKEPKKREEKPEKKKEEKKGKSRKVKETPGYKYFCEEMRKEIKSEKPDWNDKKINAELNKNWEELSDADRETCELEAATGCCDDSVDDESDSSVLED